MKGERVRVGEGLEICLAGEPVSHILRNTISWAPDTAPGARLYTEKHRDLAYLLRGFCNDMEPIDEVGSQYAIQLLPITCSLATSGRKAVEN